MKVMGQIITWSVRDESLHTASAIRLFKTFIEENPEVWNDAFERDLYRACETLVTHEDAFIDLAFEQGGVEGLAAPEVKAYPRNIANRRLPQPALQPPPRPPKTPNPIHRRRGKDGDSPMKYSGTPN